jgi:hypothetical protein
MHTAWSAQSLAERSHKKHTALVPMIEIGCFEWVDMVYINCISNCTYSFKAYSSICIYLLYAVAMLHRLYGCLYLLALWLSSIT